MKLQGILMQVSNLSQPGLPCEELGNRWWLARFTCKSAHATCPPQMAYQVVRKSAALNTLQSQLEERQGR